MNEIQKETEELPTSFQNALKYARMVINPFLRLEDEIRSLDISSDQIDGIDFVIIKEFSFFSSNPDEVSSWFRIDLISWQKALSEAIKENSQEYVFMIAEIQQKPPLSSLELKVIDVQFFARKGYSSVQELLDAFNYHVSNSKTKLVVTKIFRMQKAKQLNLR